MALPPNRGTVSTTAMSTAMSTGTGMAMTLVTVAGTLPCDAAAAALGGQLRDMHP